MSDVDPTADGEQEDDEEPATQPFYPGSDMDKIQVLVDWLPDEEKHTARTILDKYDGKNVAGLKILPLLFPHMPTLKKLIDNHIEEYRHAKLAEGGKIRGEGCVLYTSDADDDRQWVDLGCRRITTKNITRNSHPRYTNY